MAPDGMRAVNTGVGHYSRVTKLPPQIEDFWAGTDGPAVLRSSRNGACAH